MEDIADGLQLNLHAGHQTVKHNSSFSYSDWKIGFLTVLRLAATCRSTATVFI